MSVVNLIQRLSSEKGVMQHEIGVICPYYKQAHIPILLFLLHFIITAVHRRKR